MPKAGMAMEEGQIIRWLKEEGDSVQTGEALLEIETDKVAMEVEAERSGVLLKITRGAGETVPVTEPIGYIGEKGEQVPDEAAAPGGTSERTDKGTGAEVPAESGDGASDTGAGTPAQAADHPGTTQRLGASDRPAATPYARTLAQRYGVDLSVVRGTGSHGEIKGRDVEQAARGEAGGTAASQIDATPVARRVAEQKGVDLAKVNGTGTRGRITKEDVLAAAEAPQPQPATSGTVGAEPTGAASERKRFSSMRRTIARNMLASHQSIPPVTLNGYADVSRLLEMRSELNEEDPDNKLSVNDFVLKATIEALRRHSGLNATVDMESEEIVEYSTVHLGVAVALPDGLVVPKIENAEQLSLRALGTRVRELAEAARSRSLNPDQLAGATFTVTNLGMYGVTTFTPIINPPQAGILGVGSIEDDLRLDEDGRVHARKIMGLSLTIDHRVIDGAQGAEFLRTLRTLLEHPVRFLSG